MYINVSASAFHASSISQFLVNMQGSLPLLNICVGISRIRSSCDAKDKNFLASDFRVLWGHRVRGIIEIFGGGVVLLALEITAKVLYLVIVQLLLRLAGVCFIGVISCIIFLVSFLAFFVQVSIASIKKCFFSCEDTQSSQPKEFYPQVIYV